MPPSVPLLYCPPTPWQPAPWVPPNDPPVLEFQRGERAVRQDADWTCSCAALAWVMNALGVEAPTGGKWDEWDGVNELRRIAGPLAVTADYGLARASGVDLEAVYNAYGFACERIIDASWADLAYLCDLGIGQLGGARWYHWTGVRDYDGLAFELANPATAWKGVGQSLDAAEWNVWGRWVAVMVVDRL
jgi:hypothetical protein